MIKDLKRINLQQSQKLCCLSFFLSSSFYQLFERKTRELSESDEMRSEYLQISKMVQNIKKITHFKQKS